MTERSRSLTLLIGTHLYLGLVGLAWPIITFISFFAADDPTMSPLGEYVMTALIFGNLVYPGVFIASLVFSIRGYRREKSFRHLLYTVLFPFLTPTPWVPVVVGGVKRWSLLPG